jgi:hypothetical protein
MVRPGLRVRLVAHADPGHRLEGVIEGVSVSAADSGGSVESRVRLTADDALRPGMTGEASITLRRSNAWGAFWWALRRRVRTDLLL